jgi:hypothetical protein
MVAGNHDHLGNVTAEIAYSKDSQRWTFPSLWYSFNETSGPNNTTTQVVYIDTVRAQGVGQRRWLVSCGCWVVLRRGGIGDARRARRLDCSLREMEAVRAVHEELSRGACCGDPLRLCALFQSFRQCGSTRQTALAI